MYQMKLRKGNWEVEINHVNYVLTYQGKYHNSGTLDNPQGMGWAIEDWEKRGYTLTN